MDIITINITNPDSSVFIIGDIAKIDVKVEANSDIDSLGLFINNKFIKIGNNIYFHEVPEKTFLTIAVFFFWGLVWDTWLIKLISVC